MKSKNQENTREENLVSAPPKQEVVENVPAVEEALAPNETPTEKQITESQVEQIETEPKQEEILEVVEIPKEEVVEENPQIETIPQTEKIEENQPQHAQQEQLPTQQTQNETPQPTSQPQRPEIQTVEKIIYQTPPNFIQNLLNKARAKIQERKRNKLNKIMSLFELNSEISNSDIQKLLRTTKRSATRYLNQLEKEQKITQVGVKGRGVKYIKKQ